MPQRVIFSIEARADLRAIDRETALRLLKALARFLATDAGNVKQLEGFDPPRYRLSHWQLARYLSQVRRWRHRNYPRPQPSRGLSLIDQGA